MSMQPYVPMGTMAPFGSETMMNPYTMSNMSPMEMMTSLNNQARMKLRNEIVQPLSSLMSADLVESPTDFHIHADLPGVEDIEITTADNYLTIQAKRKVMHEVDTDIMHSVERSYGKVCRRILLPMNADYGNATAKFKDGVLTISMPKKTSTTIKQIKVT